MMLTKADHVDTADGVAVDGNPSSVYGEGKPEASVAIVIAARA